MLNQNQKNEKDLNNYSDIRVTMGLKRSIADTIIFILAIVGAIFAIMASNTALRIFGVILMIVSLVFSFWRFSICGSKVI